MTLEAVLLDGKYETLRKLREGGMGAVYLVRHRLLEELRVVKVMRAQFAGNDEMRERFLREAKSAIQLRHPNIAQLYDFAIDDEGTGTIVMEFIHGATLEQAIALRPLLAPALIVEIALQALRALGFLHKKGFVHRDVAPDNLMFTCDEEGRPLLKLIDLGIAKSAAARSRLTVAGGFLGKLRYSSPEAFRPTATGDQVGPQSDLYSFGVVLYELLTGCYPIVGKGTPGLVSGHLFDPPRAFAETDPEGRLPAPLRDAVLRALAKTPESRWESAAAFAAALKHSGVSELAEAERDREAARLFAVAPDFGPEIPLPPLGPPADRRAPQTAPPAPSGPAEPEAPERKPDLSAAMQPAPSEDDLRAGLPVAERTVALPAESLPRPVERPPAAAPPSPALDPVGESRRVALATVRELLGAGRLTEAEAVLAPLLAADWSDGAALWRELAAARQAAVHASIRATPSAATPAATSVRPEPEPVAPRESVAEAPSQVLTAVSGGASSGGGGAPPLAAAEGAAISPLAGPVEGTLSRALARLLGRWAALPRAARLGGAVAVVLLLVLIGWGTTRNPTAVRPASPSGPEPTAPASATVSPEASPEVSPAGTPATEVAAEAPVFATLPPSGVPTGVMLVDAAPWAELVDLRDERGLLVPVAGDRSTPLRLVLPAGRYVARMRDPGSGEIERLPLSVHAGQTEERTASASRYRPEDYWPGRRPSDLLMLAIDAHLRGAGPQVEGLLGSLQVSGRLERAHALLLRAAARYSRYLREGEIDPALRTAAARDVAESVTLARDLRPDTRFFSPRFVGFAGQPPPR